MEINIFESIVDPAISYLVTAALGGVIGWCVLKIKNYNSKRNELIDQVKSLKNDMIENTQMTSKAIIYSPIFSLDEKIKAYQVYRRNGGNGLAYQHMSELVGHDIDDYLAHREQS